MFYDEKFLLQLIQAQDGEVLPYQISLLDHCTLMDDVVLFSCHKVVGTFF
jgi:hypothetical protein